MNSDPARLKSVVCMLVISLWMIPSAPLAGQLKVTPNDQGLSVSDGDQPVLQLQLAVTSKDGKWPRNNYVHPLHDLNGDVITEDFPDDHGHHRGIFTAWHQVWVGDVRLGDPWVCKDFHWKEVARGNFALPNGRVTVSSTVEWQSPDLLNDAEQMLPVAREYTSITVHPVKDACRFIDFEIQLRALVPDLRIGGSEDVKGYGGFSPRIKLTSDQMFELPSGPIETIKTAISDGPWVNIRNENTGFAILQAPANPNFPQPWILRQKRSMQNAVYPGAIAVPVSQTTPTVLRYRLVIHDGTVAREDLIKLHEEFVARAK